MKQTLEQLIFSVLVVLVMGGAFSYLTCSSAPPPDVVTADELAQLDQVDISELTPTEVKRLDIVLNREVSPCGDTYSLAQALVNPNLCPLAVYARNYVIDLVKEDYNETEISQRYEARYAAVKGTAVATDGAPVMGASKPIVTIVIFSDFECPYCRRAATVLKEMVATYPDEVRVAFRNFPLAQHAHAMLGARAAVSAGLQGKFWEMHDVLFSRAEAGFDPDKVRTFAIGLGLDVDQFEDDLVSDKVTSAIQADIDQGKSLGVTGTPRIFLNGRLLEGAVSELPYRVKEELLRASFEKK